MATALTTTYCSMLSVDRADTGEKNLHPHKKKKKKKVLVNGASV